MVSIQDIERLELLFAQGQQVKAIHECRALALSELPGHNDRVSAYLSTLQEGYSQDPLAYDEWILDIGTPENEHAASAVRWCGKWIKGTPDIQKTGGFNSETRQSHVVRTRADFAHNVFIALRRMATPATATSNPQHGADTKTKEQDNRLERFYAMGGTVKTEYGKLTFIGVEALNTELANQRRHDPKTIRADLKAAYERAARKVASGKIFNAMGARTPT